MITHKHCQKKEESKGKKKIKKKRKERKAYLLTNTDSLLYLLLYTTVHIITPLSAGGFSSSICTATKKAPTPNDASSESSRREMLPSYVTFLAPTLFRLWRSHRASGKSAQGCTIYAIACGTPGYPLYGAEPFAMVSPFPTIIEEALFLRGRGVIDRSLRINLSGEF